MPRLHSLSLGFFLLSLGPSAIGQPTSGESGRVNALTVEKISYGGWPNCYRLANGTVELIVTSDVGPRVMRFGFMNEENEFKEYKDQLGKTGGEDWRIYGGHRLWHAPEAKPRTYWPDNFPLEVSTLKDGLQLVQSVEKTTGIHKEITLTLDPTSSHVKLIHRLRNNGAWPVELAPWTLTVMEVGGKVIIPQPQYKSHDEELLPVRSMAIWGYTNMQDPRYSWGSKYIVLTQDASAREPTKIGVGVKEGWAAYLRHGHLFIKRFEYENGASYPDYGCSIESFTNADMIELETLGPLRLLQSGSAIEYIEDWYLFKGVEPVTDEASIDRVVMPLVNLTGRK